MKKHLLLYSLCLSAVFGCSGTSGSGNSAPATNTTKEAITLSNTAMIPVDPTQGSTTTTVYVNNDSDHTINDIGYHAKNPLNSNVLQVSSGSAARCASIPAHSSCALTVEVNDDKTNGALLVASYTTDNRQVSTVRAINVGSPSNSESGIVFSGSTMLASPHKNANNLYATLYLRAAGTGKSYKLNSISLSNSTAVIVDGYSQGMIIQSGSVQPINIRIPKSSGQLAPINVVVNSSEVTSATKTTNRANTSFSSNATLGSLSTSGPVLVNTTPQLLNLSESSSGSFFIANSGNESATLGSISADNTTISNNCGSSLAPDTSCEITYTPTKASSNKYGEVSVNYTPAGPAGSLLTIGLGWYESVNAALVDITTTKNPVIFNATETTNGSITFINAGGYELSDFTPNIQTGSLSKNAQLSDIVNHCSSTLAVGQSCSVDYTISDATDENGIISATVNASYNESGSTQTYSRVLPITFIAQPYAAALVADDLTMSTIIGDNIDSTTGSFKVVNQGSAPAQISAITNASLPAYLIEQGSTCSSSTLLNAGESCTIGFKLGPVSIDATTSSQAISSINYSGGETLAATEDVAVNYTVNGNQQGMEATAEASSGSTGSGTESDSFIFSFDSSVQGRQAGSEPFITVTYKNSGSNTLLIKGVSRPFNPYWDMTTDCENKQLETNGTCTITYTSNLAETILYGDLVASPVDVGISLPYITAVSVNTGQQFYQATKTINTLYAKVNVPVVTPTVTYDPANYKVSFNYSLIMPGTSSYSISIMGISENYMLENGAVYSGCNATFDSSSSILEQNCTLNGSSTASAIFNVESAIWNHSNTVDLTGMFSVASPSDKPVIMAPRKTKITLTK